MTEQIARYKPGQNLPVFAETQILAGRFVTIDGKADTGAYNGNHTAAGAAADGVSEQDSAPASFPAHSHDRMVNVVRGGAIAMVVAGAAITAGAEVQSTSVGKAITQTTGIALGRALTTASGDNDVIEVALYGQPGQGSPATGNSYVEGTPQADIADVAVTGAASAVTGAAFTPVTATSPGAGADGTTPSGAQWTAAVADITAAQADLVDIYTTLNAQDADIADVYTTLAAFATAINSILDVLDEYGMTA